MTVINISEEQLKLAYNIATQPICAHLTIPLDSATISDIAKDIDVSFKLNADNDPFSEDKTLYHKVKVRGSIYLKEERRFKSFDLFSVDNYIDETYRSYEAFRKKFDRLFSVAGVQKKVHERFAKYTNTEEEISFQLIQEGEEDAS